MSADTIAQVLEAQAALSDKVFVVIDDDRLTYAGAEERSRRLAAALITAGAGRGSRVAMLMGNSTEFAVTFLGITRIGAVALPFSTMSTPHELAGMLARADCEYLIAAKGYRGRDFREVMTEVLGQGPDGRLMVPAIPTLRCVWFGADSLEGAGAPDAPVLAADAQVTPADTMVLVHTSGSTSAPKGVIHTHGQMMRNMRRQNTTRRYTAGEVLFANAPWFWVGGLAYSFLATLIAGARLVCSSARPAEMLDLIERERPTMTNGIATTTLALEQDPSFAARDLSFMRRGNLYPIMPPEVRPRDPELRHNLLGMTETGSVCIVGESEDDLPESMRGSYGKPVEGVDIRIVDPETGQNGPEGELWLRGPNVMQGYYGRERLDTFDEEGWYHSGDMFSIDAQGYCYFKGRTGDIIRTNGAQVSPREVEGVLSDVTGGRTAIVVGVPDPARGQSVTAILVGSDPVDEAWLTAALRERLSAYKVPRRFLTMEESELPTLSSGKIDLKKLAGLASGR
ncbi:MAG: acyl--CoA ligase [Alphaproteobacteria bacterium]|nr:acyl--CoA ligase [Alphaproteobacteria bacterium]